MPYMAIKSNIKTVVKIKVSHVRISIIYVNVNFVCRGDYARDKRVCSRFRFMMNFVFFAHRAVS